MQYRQLIVVSYAFLLCSCLGIFASSTSSPDVSPNTISPTLMSNTSIINTEMHGMLGEQLNNRYTLLLNCLAILFGCVVIPMVLIKQARQSYKKASEAQRARPQLDVENARNNPENATKKAGSKVQDPSMTVRQIRQPTLLSTQLLSLEIFVYIILLLTGVTYVPIFFNAGTLPKRLLRTIFSASFFGSLFSFGLYAILFFITTLRERYPVYAENHVATKPKNSKENSFFLGGKAKKATKPTAGNSAAFDDSMEVTPVSRNECCHSFSGRQKAVGFILFTAFTVVWSVYFALNGFVDDDVTSNVWLLSCSWRVLSEMKRPVAIMIFYAMALIVFAILVLQFILLLHLVVRSFRKTHSGPYTRENYKSLLRQRYFGLFFTLYQILLFIIVYLYWKADDDATHLSLFDACLKYSYFGVSVLILLCSSMHYYVAISCCSCKIPDGEELESRLPNGTEIDGSNASLLSSRRMPKPAGSVRRQLGQSPRGPFSSSIRVESKGNDDDDDDDDDDSSPRGFFVPSFQPESSLPVRDARGGSHGSSDARLLTPADRLEQVFDKLKKQVAKEAKKRIVDATETMRSGFLWSVDNSLQFFIAHTAKEDYESLVLECKSHEIGPRASRVDKLEYACLGIITCMKNLENFYNNEAHHIGNIEDIDFEKIPGMHFRHASKFADLEETSWNIIKKIVKLVQDEAKKEKEHLLMIINRLIDLCWENQRELNSMYEDISVKLPLTTEDVESSLKQIWTTIKRTEWRILHTNVVKNKYYKGAVEWQNAIAGYLKKLTSVTDLATRGIIYLALANVEGRIEGIEGRKVSEKCVTDVAVKYLYEIKRLAEKDLPKVVGVKPQEIVKHFKDRFEAIKTCLGDKTVFTLRTQQDDLRLNIQWFFDKIDTNEVAGARHLINVLTENGPNIVCEAGIAALMRHFATLAAVAQSNIGVWALRYPEQERVDSLSGFTKDILQFRSNLSTFENYVVGFIAEFVISVTSISKPDGGDDVFDLSAMNELATRLFRASEQEWITSLDVVIKEMPELTSKLVSKIEHIRDPLGRLLALAIDAIAKFKEIHTTLRSMFSEFEEFFKIANQVVNIPVSLSTLENWVTLKTRFQMSLLSLDEMKMQLSDDYYLNIKKVEMDFKTMAGSGKKFDEHLDKCLFPSLFYFVQHESQYDGIDEMLSMLKNVVKTELDRITKAEGPGRVPVLDNKKIRINRKTVISNLLKEWTIPNSFENKIFVGKKMVRVKTIEKFLTHVLNALADEPFASVSLDGQPVSVIPSVGAVPMSCDRILWNYQVIFEQFALIKLQYHGDWIYDEKIIDYQMDMMTSIHLSRYLQTLYEHCLNGTFEGIDDWEKQAVNRERTVSAIEKAVVSRFIDIVKVNGASLVVDDHRMDPAEPSMVNDWNMQEENLGKVVEKSICYPLHCLFIFAICTKNESLKEFAQPKVAAAYEAVGKKFKNRNLMEDFSDRMQYVNYIMTLAREAARRIELLNAPGENFAMADALRERVFQLIMSAVARVASGMAMMLSKHSDIMNHGIKDLDEAAIKFCRDSRHTLVVIKKMIVGDEIESKADDSVQLLDSRLISIAERVINKPGLPVGVIGLDYFSLENMQNVLPTLANVKISKTLTNKPGISAFKRELNGLAMKGIVREADESLCQAEIKRLVVRFNRTIGEMLTLLKRCSSNWRISEKNTHSILSLHDVMKTSVVAFQSALPLITLEDNILPLLLNSIKDVENYINFVIANSSNERIVGVPQVPMALSSSSSSSSSAPPSHPPSS